MTDALESTFEAIFVLLYLMFSALISLVIHAGFVVVEGATIFHRSIHS